MVQKFADVERLNDVGVCTTASVLHSLVQIIRTDYNRVVLLLSFPSSCT